jgi:hypothetical protein
VSDGHHTQSVALNQGSQAPSIGSYTASNFATSDGHGEAPIGPVTSIGTNTDITSGTGSAADPVTGPMQVVGKIEDAVWGPVNGATDPPNPSLQWLENLVQTVVSDLEEMKPVSGFQHLLNQIEGWRSSSGSGSASIDQPSRSSHSTSRFTAGWQSHMVQTLASFEVGTGGPPQENPIQSTDQATQGYLAVPHS